MTDEDFTPIRYDALAGRPKNMCGGCQGQGAHRRWCPNVVGPRAAVLGAWSMRVDDLADEVGSNDTGTTNLLYAAAGRLRRKAEWVKAHWQGQHTPTPEDQSSS